MRLADADADADAAADGDQWLVRGLMQCRPFCSREQRES